MMRAGRRPLSWDLLLPALAALAVAAYLVTELDSPTLKATALSAAAAYLAFLFWLSRKSPELRYSVVLSQVAAIVGLFGAELYVTHDKFENYSTIGRAKQLTEAGDAAWPAIPPSTWYFDIARAEIDAGRQPLPLAGLSQVKTVLCKEAQGWVTFVADRHGFRNPPRPEGPANVDVLMVGDSFAEGTCVDEEGTLAAVLRKSGLSVLNLGMHGSGPLFTLAILQEYGDDASFRRLVWVFFEGNDIYDLTRESESAFLRRYLAEGAFQKLARRQSEVDAAMRDGLKGRDARFSARDVARLKELRSAAGIMGIGQGGNLRPQVAPQLPHLAEVLGLARRFAEAKGTSMTMLYVPAPTRFVSGSRDAAYFAAMEQSVTTLACRSGIDFVSMSRVLASTPDPLDNYALMGGRYGHFTPAG